MKNLNRKHCLTCAKFNIITYQCCAGDVPVEYDDDYIDYECPSYEPRPLIDTGV
jgi:hypothetical protein